MAPPNGSSTAGTVAALPIAEQILEPSPGAKLRRRIFGHAGVTIGAGVLLIIIAVALLAPVLAPYDPLDQDLTRRVIPPVWHEKGSWEHPLGTDQFGRDYLSRLMYGARISLLIGFVAMLISGVLGTALVSYAAPATIFWMAVMRRFAFTSCFWMSSQSGPAYLEPSQSGCSMRSSR